MRRTVMLAALLIVVPGCSVALSGVGIDVGELKDRAAVQDCLGEPEESGAERGVAFDVFSTRRWIRLPFRVIGNRMAAGMSAGLAEPFLFVRALLHLVTWPISAHDLRIEYDTAGHVRGASCDGESAMHPDRFEESGDGE